MITLPMLEKSISAVITMGYPELARVQMDFFYGLVWTRSFLQQRWIIIFKNPVHTTGDVLQNLFEDFFQFLVRFTNFSQKLRSATSPRGTINAHPMYTIAFHSVNRLRYPKERFVNILT